MNFEAILFDCDGVLVDSESLTCGVLRDMFEEQGWRMSLAECMQRFVGHTVKSQRDIIEANTGQALTVHLDDHFDATHIPLTCTAAPVHDTLGRLQAAADAAGNTAANVFGVAYPSGGGTLGNGLVFGVVGGCFHPEFLAYTACDRSEPCADAGLYGCVIVPEAQGRRGWGGRARFWNSRRWACARRRCLR